MDAMQRVKCLDTGKAYCMRVTKKLLIKQVNEALKRYEIIVWECVEIERSRFRGQDYEAGAYYWRAKLVNSKGWEVWLYCFFSFSCIEEHLNNGEIIGLKKTAHNNLGLISDYELWPVKI